MDPSPAIVDAPIRHQQPVVTTNKLKRTLSLNAENRDLSQAIDPMEPVLSGRQHYNSRRFNHNKHSGPIHHRFSGSTQSLHQSMTRDSPSPPPRSLSPDLRLLDDFDRSYRSRMSTQRHNNYESDDRESLDYEDQRFSLSSSTSGNGRRHSQRSSKTRATTAAALENRRRMFEKEPIKHQGRGSSRWEPSPDYSDSYSDVELTKRHPKERVQRDRERVAEYRRYFQQQANNNSSEDFNATLKPTVRRKTSQPSSDSRRYPSGQVDLYRSRFEVIL